MASKGRDEKLKADLAAMQALAQQSSILEFSTDDDPPESYEITLKGRGITRTGSYKAEVEPIEEHKCEIRLSYRYPERAPEVRWLTPIFHPNVSYSGNIRLEDCGIRWEEGLTLDVVCEHLWDVARLAHFDLDKASNYQAKKWFEEQTEMTFPVDDRPLRDRGGPAASNVVRYERTAAVAPVHPQRAGRVADESADQKTMADDDVLFIDDDTPTPELPKAPPRRDRGDDDILYIGE